MAAGRFASRRISVERSSTTRVHGTCKRDRAPLRFTEQSRVALIPDDGEARLLVQELAPERIHHADGAFSHRANHVVLQPALLHQLVDQNPLVDERDVHIAGEELPVPVLHLPRIGDHAFKPVSPEEVAKDDELALRRDVGPVHDRDARGLARARSTRGARREQRVPPRPAPMAAASSGTHA